MILSLYNSFNLCFQIFKIESKHKINESYKQCWVNDVRQKNTYTVSHLYKVQKLAKLSMWFRDAYL